MPGIRDNPVSTQWFEQVFGFPEVQDADAPAEALRCAGGASEALTRAKRRRQYTNTRSHFRFSDGVLTVRESGARFHVGSFECLSVEDLHGRLHKATSSSGPAHRRGELGRLSFCHTVASFGDLHLDPANVGAVFQVASLYNCLETTPPAALPDDGVTRYAQESTQGTACSVACPAATVFRNYFVNGSGQAGADKQLDCLSRVGKVLGNASEYWTMTSGHCLPTVGTRFARLANRLRTDGELAERARQHLQVGIHWDTEVLGGAHRVCQVFCSALPVALAKRTTRIADFEPLAVPLLRSAYEATLTAASVLAAERDRRVRVFLTLVGGGALGNRRKWILDAIEAGLVMHRDEPLDVVLVHPTKIPQDPAWRELEFGREPDVVMGITKPLDHGELAGKMHKQLKDLSEAISAGGSVSVQGLDIVWRRLDANGDGVIDRSELEAVMAWNNSWAGKVVKAFSSLDINGDGIIDRSELMIVLQSLDDKFFTEGTVDILLDEADADGDGEIHYMEFVAWLCGEEPLLVSRMLSASALYDVG